jgi:ribosomal protein L12E/L44/L45/RPP1/RPP2
MPGSSGLQMMLKAMGIEFTPDQITAIITQLQATVMNVDARLTRIEQKLDAIRHSASVQLAAEFNPNQAGVAEAAQEVNGGQSNDCYSPVNHN